MYVFELRRIWRQKVRYRYPAPPKQLYTTFIRRKIMSTFVLFFTTWCVVGHGVFNYILTETDEHGNVSHISVEEALKRARERREKQAAETEAFWRPKPPKLPPPYHDPQDV
ncbi:hypothetical protein M3Y99_01161200 [Aphelenchoides fujianensis]|nr:hypothetical protein M3Y99_01161200 [Aphelenchoides fujianensis]